MKRFFVLAFAIALLSGPAFGQLNFKITSTSAGGVKLGMTVQQARRLLKGGIYTRPSTQTTRYEPGSEIFSIQISRN